MKGFSLSFEYLPRFGVRFAVGESGVSWATPLNSTKKAEEKMLMSSIVWSYSKDLLHHAALKIHLVVGKFQGGKKKIILSFLPSYA